jgi:hypothetical protein
MCFDESPEPFRNLAMVCRNDGGVGDRQAEWPPEQDNDGVYLGAGRQGESAASAGEPGVGALTGGNAKPFFTPITTLCSAQIHIALHHKL